jgi:hypothetical protein
LWKSGDAQDPTNATQPLTAVVEQILQRSTKRRRTSVFLMPLSLYRVYNSVIHTFLRNSMPKLLAPLGAVPISKSAIFCPTSFHCLLQATFVFFVVLFVINFALLLLAHDSAAHCADSKSALVLGPSIFSCQMAIDEKPTLDWYWLN